MALAEYQRRQSEAAKNRRRVEAGLYGRSQREQAQGGAGNHAHTMITTCTCSFCSTLTSHMLPQQAQRHPLQLHTRRNIKSLHLRDAQCAPLVPLPLGDAALRRRHTWPGWLQRVVPPLRSGCGCASSTTGAACTNTRAQRWPRSAVQHLVWLHHSMAMDMAVVAMHTAVIITTITTILLRATLEART